MNARPNFLIVMTDQHRADWLGCAGHPVLRTPHIDALAARGARFTDFNVASPVCMPNRASILTGRYPSVHGLRHNGLHLPMSANTFVDVMRDGGYWTGLIGKSHIQPMTDIAPNMGAAAPARDDALREAVKPDGESYDWEEPWRYEADDPVVFPQPYYGFEHVDMVTGHGANCGGHYLQWLRQSNADWRALRDPANELAHGYRCPQAHRTPLPEALYPTAYIRDRAIDFLAAARRRGQPFLAFVSFPDPHHPFTPPGRYWDMYRPEQFAVDLPYSAHRNPPPPLRACRAELEDGTRQTKAQKLFMAHERELREAMALSAGMIAMIDDAVGDILAALDANGQTRDTVVIFTSDHGDYLGAFSLLLKGPIQHRSINQVPFIWADGAAPDGPPTVGGLYSSLDIAPSVLARAGLTPYHGMQGRDLTPALAGGPPVRDRLLIEHEDSQPKPGLPKRPNLRTVLTERYRVTVYAGETWGEIYDLRDDPNETHNLWDEPGAATLKAELLRELADAMIDAGDRSPWPRRRA